MKGFVLSKKEPLSELKAAESLIEVQEKQRREVLGQYDPFKYIAQIFGLDYTPCGMRDLLKKFKCVPGNPDLDAQEIFVKQYEDFINNGRKALSKERGSICTY
jgi:hypothetical protein